MYCITYIFIIIPVLLTVGFFTLLERKVLGYIHLRKGPTKVGFMGLLQPFSDGLSLFISDQIGPVSSNYLIYYLCPVYSLIHSLFIWVLFPIYFNLIDFSFGLLFFLCCLSLSIYGLMVSGWSSNSTYSILGCIRSVSQAISYELSLSLIIFCYFFLVDGYCLMDYFYLQNFFWFSFIFLPLFIVWVSSCMAESNRTPFDFSEGESELVSGFNVEYGGGGFAFLFISEYSSIIFISLFTCSVFLGSDYNTYFFYFKLILICFLFIWIRSTLPRYRYDKLMNLTWKCYLPISLNSLMFFLMISCWVFYQFFLLS